MLRNSQAKKQVWRSQLGSPAALTSDSDPSTDFSWRFTLSVSTAPLYLLQMSSSE